MRDYREAFEDFEREVFELVARHFPGAIEGETAPHAFCCSALQEILGNLLVWRMVKSGEDGLRDALRIAGQGIEASARAHWETAQRLREEMLPRYVSGPDTKQ